MRHLRKRPDERHFQSVVEKRSAVDTGRKMTYSIKAEAGQFKVKVGGGSIANSAIVISDTLRSPQTNTVIVSSDEEAKRAESGENIGGGGIVVRSEFKLILWAVILITAFSGLAEIVMAGLWTTPTNMQQEVFDKMGLAWQVGVGALIGLIGGKVT